MGKALANATVQYGCDVEFVTGPVAEQNLPNLSPEKIHNVVGAEEMLSTAQKFFESSDVIIFAAAVADYAPVQQLPEKIAKSTKELTLRLRPTPDIAKTLCRNKSAQQVTIGFALQTSNGEANARHKLETKNLDGIVLNTPASLGASDGTFSFLSTDSPAFDEWGCIDKTECALKIFEQVEKLTP